MGLEPLWITAYCQLLICIKSFQLLEIKFSLYFVGFAVAVP